MTESVRSILLVEDDALLRQAFRMLLEDAGYAVLEAGTARDALAHARTKLPSIVLLDLGLPDRSGLEVASELRADAKTADIPVVALTGRVGAAEKRACLDAGCVAYLAKPVEAKLLLRRVPEILAEAGR